MANSCLSCTKNGVFFSAASCTKDTISGAAQTKLGPSYFLLGFSRFANRFSYFHKWFPLLNSFRVNKFSLKYYKTFLALLCFQKSLLNPISTRGDKLCPPNYYWHTQILRPSDGPDLVVANIFCGNTLAHSTLMEKRRNKELFNSTNTHKFKNS